jgi:hypothetical protein
VVVLSGAPRGRFSQAGSPPARVVEEIAELRMNSASSDSLEAVTNPFLGPGEHA